MIAMGVNAWCDLNEFEVFQNPTLMAVDDASLTQYKYNLRKISERANKHVIQPVWRGMRKSIAALVLLLLNLFKLVHESMKRTEQPSSPLYVFKDITYTGLPDNMLNKPLLNRQGR